MPVAVLVGHLLEPKQKAAGCWERRWGCRGGAGALPSSPRSLGANYCDSDNMVPYTWDALR